MTCSPITTFDPAMSLAIRPIQWGRTLRRFSSKKTALDEVFELRLVQFDKPNLPLGFDHALSAPSSATS